MDGKIKAKLNATGSAPIFACRVWVKFNGTNGNIYGTSGNVLSVTYNGSGSCTVNFLTPLPDADYACLVSAVDTGAAGTSLSQPSSYASSAVAIRTTISSFDNAAADNSGVVSVAIFR